MNVQFRNSGRLIQIDYRTDIDCCNQCGIKEAVRCGAVVVY